jgi:hypothetical protein
MRSGRPSRATNFHDTAGRHAIGGEPLPIPVCPEGRVAEHALQQAARRSKRLLPEPHAVKATDLLVRGHGAIAPRREEALALGLDQRDRHPVRIREAQHALAEPVLGSCGNVAAPSRSAQYPRLPQVPPASPR